MRADAPEAANLRPKQISALFSWVVKEEYAKLNRAEGVANASEDFYTWTKQDVLVFERHHPIGTKPRLAMALLLWLGVRRTVTNHDGFAQGSPLWRCESSYITTYGHFCETNPILTGGKLSQDDTPGEAPIDDRSRML